jgi:hypothetical protein
MNTVNHPYTWVKWYTSPNGTTPVQMRNEEKKTTACIEPSRILESHIGNGTKNVLERVKRELSRLTLEKKNI